MRLIAGDLKINKVQQVLLLKKNYGHLEEINLSYRLALKIIQIRFF